MTRLIRRRSFTAGLAALTLTALAVPGPALASEAPDTTAYRIELPAPSGRHAIGTTELHLVDRHRADPWVAGRQRELMVSVWYPARRHDQAPPARYMPPRAAQAIGAEIMTFLGLKPEQVDLAGTLTHARSGVQALGRHPVVVYSPGFGTSRLVGTNHVEELASHGYVVVTVDHTGEAPVEFPGGRITGVELPGLEGPDLVRKATAVRVADTRFVLDALAVLRRGGNPDAGRRMLPHGLGRSLDLSRTAMFGYSLGGLTAGEVMLRDRRVDAGVNMDGTMMYDQPGRTQLSDVAQRGLDRPFLLMGAMDHHHRSDLSWTTFWERQRGWKLDLQIAHGTHAAFADYQFILPQLDAEFGIPAYELEFLVGTVDPGRSVAAQRAYLRAFVDRFLRHRPQPLLDRESPEHPDVTFVR